MTDREAEPLLQVVLEAVAEGTGCDVDDERRVVHVADAGQAAQVQHHTAVQRDGRAAHA